MAWLVCSIAAAGLAAALSPHAAAQTANAGARDFTLTVWETDQDLPSNDVLSLLVDRNGFLWVGTASGLVRFDGRDFLNPAGPDDQFFRASTVYSIAEEARGEIVFVHDLDAMNRLMAWSPLGMRQHPAGLALAPDQKARAVFQERLGVCWVLTHDREWKRWSSQGVLGFPPPYPISESQQSSFVVAEDGRVFLSRGSGVDVYNNGSLDPLTEVGTSPAAIARSGKGGVWIANQKSLFLLEDDTLESKPIPPELLEAWPPSLILESQDGALWLAFRSAGLFRLDAHGLVELPTSHQIPRCMTEDREGNLWLGTAGGGLNRIRRSSFELSATNVADTIGSICEDASGTLWLGNARGIWKIVDGKAHAPENPQEWPNFAHAVCADSDGNLWIGGSRGVFRYREGIDAFPQAMLPQQIDHAYALFRAADGSMWAGCESGPLLRYDRSGQVRTYGPEQGYDGRIAQVFGEDSSGNLWVGTRLGGLFRLDGERFVRMQTPLAESGTGILTITPGSSGELWLGTRGLGFLRLKDGTFKRVGIEHGLPDGVIAQTLADEAGNLWVGSSNSIFMVEIEDLNACADGLAKAVRPVRFGRADGITGFFATGQRQPCAWQGEDGRMWFVGRKGVASIHPSHRNVVPAIPRIFIDQALADTSALVDGGRISSATRRLEFRFTSPTFVSPEDVRFRYRLQGFDAQWTDAAGQRFVVFPQLPPGDYSFEVTASNRRKIWNPQPARFQFTVMPVWWQLWWLRALAALAVVAAAVWTARQWSNRRLRRKTAALEQERKVGRERERIARDLHDGIGSGLTQAAWLVAELKDEAGPSPDLSRQADALGTRIRDLARDLDAAVWAVSPKHDTLASLCAYLCETAIEHFRHTPVRCRVDVPDRLPDGPLAPHLRNHLFMATREALNNVLKHSGASEVHLELACTANTFTITITDNGCGFDPQSTEHTARHGLENLRARMREIHGLAEISSGPQGTRVRLSAPLHA
jgi:signal transduction histidine kinase/ligand-binding sensor domain-containing protein